MRYLKGAIALSVTKDLPLLRHVMYSKYVTQMQLWQFMRHSEGESSRGSFWWRIKRLADHGFIARHLVPMVHGDVVLTIAAPGIVYLVESFGTPYSGPGSGPEVRPDFDAYLMVDWSASSRPTTGADSIWYCLMVRTSTALHVAALENPSTRVAAMAEIGNVLCGLARQGQDSAGRVRLPVWLPGRLRGWTSTGT